MGEPYNASSVLVRSTIEPVAAGIWVIRGGMDYATIPLSFTRGHMPHRLMNVYVIQEDDGVTLFDAGIEAMTDDVRVLTDRMGGLKRIVLGHAHADHRGVAPGLDAPVICHEDAKAEAESSTEPDYVDYTKIEPRLARAAFPKLLAIWDGGPVKVDSTLKEGDEIAGFEVKLFDGHAPGQIGLWRESDRLCLCSDTVYTLDPLTSKMGDPRVPHPFYTQDTPQALRSIAKLAELGPREVWPGHANAVIGPDVVEKLERASRG